MVHKSLPDCSDVPVVKGLNQVEPSRGAVGLHPLLQAHWSVGFAGPSLAALSDLTYRGDTKPSSPKILLSSNVLHDTIEGKLRGTSLTLPSTTVSEIY